MLTKQINYLELAQALQAAQVKVVQVEVDGSIIYSRLLLPMRTTKHQPFESVIGWQDAVLEVDGEVLTEILERVINSAAQKLEIRAHWSTGRDFLWEVKI